MLLWFRHYKWGLKMTSKTELRKEISVFMKRIKTWVKSKDITEQELTKTANALCMFEVGIKEDCVPEEEYQKEMKN